MTIVAEAPETSSAWVVRRMRAEMLQTLPDLPKALCDSRDVDPDLFHPARANRRQEFEAMALCMKCPEMLSCLGFAVRAHPVNGVWGGTTEAQRRVFIENTDQRNSLME